MNKYKSDANHVWNIDADCSFVDVDVTKMDTEQGWDYLYIHENEFSGQNPMKVNLKILFSYSFFENVNDKYNLCLIHIYFSSLTCQAHSKSHSAQMKISNMMDSLSTGHAQTIFLVSRFNKVFYIMNSDVILFLFFMEL